LYQRLWIFQFRLFTFHPPRKNSIHVQKIFTVCCKTAVSALYKMNPSSVP
jgi:hypothetical protein